ncbi:MAG: 30S ribosome-binding factor RbfA [Acidobacteria bacterium]|nr:30S ribosome-binding factor RbfA [Acidobacteriota bacterium]
MPHTSFDRNARLQEAIRSMLTDLLMFEVKDPRLEGVTISGVRLSGDRAYARIYFSLIGGEELEARAVEGFAAASSFLRRELGRRMRLRIVPELRFMRDTSYEYGDHMERVLEKLHEEGLIPPEDDAPNGKENE